MRKIMLMAGCVVMMANLVLAQGFDLQVAESAAATEQGQLRVTGGFNTGESDDLDLMYFGGRLSYGLVENLLVFAGAGLVDTDSDSLDSAVCVSGGPQYALPMELPVDVAVRATLAKPFFDDIEVGSGRKESVDVLTMTVMGIASKELTVTGLTVYGGAGFARTSTDVGNNDDSETDLALTGGALYQVNDMFSAFAEVTHVDDLFLGAGVRVDL